MSNTSVTPVMSDGVYQWLKQIVQIGLPACGTLYFTLAQIWGLPHAENVVGTIAALTTFLGIFLALASRRYQASDERYDGIIDVLEADNKKNFSLTLNSDPDTLDKKNEVLFKVNVPTL